MTSHPSESEISNDENPSIAVSMSSQNIVDMSSLNIENMPVFLVNEE